MAKHFFNLGLSCVVIAVILFFKSIAATGDEKLLFQVMVIVSGITGAVVIIFRRKLTWKTFCFSMIASMFAVVIVEMGLTMGLELVHRMVPSTIDKSMRLTPFRDQPWAAEFFRESLDLELGYTRSVGFITKPVSGLYLNIDSMGQRKTWNPAESDMDTLIIFGGSTIFGIGARDEYTIPSFLSKKLSAAKHPLYTINVGQSGRNTLQEINHLVWLLQNGLRPKYVVFYDGANDLNHSYVFHKTANEGFVPQMDEFLKLQKSGLSDQLIFAFKNGMLHSKVFKAIKRLFPPEPAYLSRPQVDVNFVSNRIRFKYLTIKNILDDMSRRYNFRLHCFWQPMVYTKKNLTEEEIESDGRAPESDFKELVIQTNNLLMNDTAYNFSNISNVFDSVDHTIFIDYCHISEEGNEIVAQKMFEILSTRFFKSKE